MAEHVEWLDRLRWAAEKRLTRDYREVTLGEHECRQVLAALAPPQGGLPMSNVQRWNQGNPDDDEDYVMQLSANGDYVDYDDHVAALAEKDAELARLRKGLEHIRDSTFRSAVVLRAAADSILNGGAP